MARLLPLSNLANLCQFTSAVSHPCKFLGVINKMLDDSSIALKQSVLFFLCVRERESINSSKIMVEIIVISALTKITVIICANL